ncbi:MAG: HAD family phosphatase [Candidatus Magasanikbacteria bacterium]
MKYKAVIYDMDGLLIDSMIHWMHSDDRFYKPRGVTLTPDLIKFLTGKSLRENMTWLKEEYKLEESVEELIVERARTTDNIYTDLTTDMPGATRLIKRLKREGFKQAIASGSMYERIKLVVQRFGWDIYLDKLISADHVQDKGKPDPGIFLHAAKQLDIHPADCIVFEDAENGVVAAKRAGMTCIAALDKRWSFGDFSQADLIVESLEDKRIFDFLELSYGQN